MAGTSKLHTDLAIPPEEYLLEAMRELGVTRSELARRMGRPEQTVQKIFDGEMRITSDVATHLKWATGVSAGIWIGLENEYRIALAQEGE